ncbi:MAG: FG-GAP repeat domain-containing protein, partial [Pirellulaceae bacterium]
MSGKKQKQKNSSKTGPPKRRNRATERTTDHSTAASTSTTSSSQDKQHLSPATILLVLLPVLAVCGAVTWYVLNSGDDPVNPSTDVAQSRSKDVAEKDRDNTKTDQDTIADAKQQKVWATTSDHEAKWDQIDDAASDGWDTEVISDRVTDQWNKLKKLLASDKTIDATGVGPITTDGVLVHSVVPSRHPTVFETDRIKVQRQINTDTEASTAEPFGTGAESLARALIELLEPYADRQNLRLKWKVFRVTPGDETVVTQQTLEIFGKTTQGYREENATWLCEWTLEKKPHLKSVRVVRYETVDVKEHRLFADCTESLFGDNASFHQQILKGFNEWLERRQTHSSFAVLANNGVAIGDVNADGLEDLYLCQESELPNLLFLQNPDGTLRDVSGESGVDWLQNSSAALILDLNNDGHQDLAVGVNSTLVIAQGDSTGKFEVREMLDTTDEVWSLTSADYDRDGLLDLHVGTYTPTGIASVAANVVLTMADFADGGLNTLFRNETSGDQFSFRNVTEETGMNVNNRRKTYSAAWEDLDNDGDQDLYVANDFGWNCFFRNDQTDDGQTVFVDIAQQAGGLDDSFGMSVNFGDYDRDGWIDVYISNMYSYAGNRITFQDQFKADSTDSVKKRFQRFARGNTLLRNAGPSTDETVGPIITFEDRSVETAVNMGRWAW